MKTKQKIGVKLIKKSLRASKDAKVMEFYGQVKALMDENNPYDQKCLEIAKEEMKRRGIDFADEWM